MDSYDHVPSRRRGRRRLIVALFLGATLASVGAGASSLAYFTSTDSTSSTWSSGNVQIGVTQLTWTTSGIYPGDSGSQTVTVNSSGLGGIHYSMATAVSNETNNLSSQLTMQIQTGACGSSSPTTLYTGPLGSAAIASRDLGGASSEALCFTWGFKSTADSTYQNSTAKATFTFNAVQSKNN